MRIGIDARMFGPKVGGGGPGRYVEQLVLHLQKIDFDNHYTVFCKRENYTDIPVPNDRWTKVVADVHWYTLAEQVMLPHIIDQQRLDLVHIPHFNVPLLLKTPFIATVHDLIMVEQPWSARATTRSRLFFETKRIGFRLTLRHVAKKAQEIITVSNYAKQQLIHSLNIPPIKVHVVYNGMDSAVTKTANTKQKTQNELSITARVRKPFLLNVGNFYPHKNIETLLHAFSFLLADHPEMSLVLAGPGNEFQARLRAEAREIAIPDDRLVFTGFIPDEELTWLYENAAVYVLPSKLEGFGIPPLEALRLGTPVAASRASCIPEILQNAAEYFDPDDIESLIQAIENLLGDTNRRTEILVNAQALFKRYRWEEAAQQVLALYRTCVSNIHEQTSKTRRAQSRSTHHP